MELDRSMIGMLRSVTECNAMQYDVYDRAEFTVTIEWDEVTCGGSTRREDDCIHGQRVEDGNHHEFTTETRARQPGTDVFCL